jgi:hypothetical protein
MEYFERKRTREHLDSKLRASTITAIRDAVAILSQADASLRNEIYVLQPAIDRVIERSKNRKAGDLVRLAEDAVRETLAEFRPDSEVLTRYFGDAVRKKLSEIL